MGAEEGVAEDHAAVAVMLTGADHVADRLGHLLALELEKGIVDPVPGERLAGGPLGLGDLVLVVGEDEVLAAAVDVEAATRYLPAMAEHSMPAGAARPQGESQVGSPGLAAFQRAKSSGSRLCGLISTPAPARSSAGSRPDSLPYSGHLPTAK